MGVAITWSHLLGASCGGAELAPQAVCLLPCPKRFAFQVVGSLGRLAPAFTEIGHSSSFTLDDMCSNGHVHRGRPIEDD